MLSFMASLFRTLNCEIHSRHPHTVAIESDGDQLEATPKLSLAYQQALAQVGTHLVEVFDEDPAYYRNFIMAGMETFAGESSFKLHTNGYDWYMPVQEFWSKVAGGAISLQTSDSTYQVWNIFSRKWVTVEQHFPGQLSC